MPEGTVATGNAWLKEAASPMLSVPSVLVPHAWNILLNPNHPDAAKIEILGIDALPVRPLPLASPGGRKLTYGVRPRGNAAT